MNYDLDATNEPSLQRVSVRIDTEGFERFVPTGIVLEIVRPAIEPVLVEPTPTRQQLTTASGATLQVATGVMQATTPDATIAAAT